MFVKLYDAVGGNFVCNLTIAELSNIAYGEQITLKKGESITTYFSPANVFLFDGGKDGYHRTSLVGWEPQATPPNSTYLLSLNNGSVFTLYAENGNSIRFSYSSVYFNIGSREFMLSTSNSGEFSYRIITFDGTNYGGIYLKYSSAVPDEIKYNGSGIDRVAAAFSADESNFLAEWFDGIIENEPPENTDPYAPGGDSETGGGTGNFSGTGDDVDIPSLPTLSSTNTGFITLFNPSYSELQELASYMWSNPLFDVSAWKKIFADPMDAILGLSIVPVQIPNGGKSDVTVGNISTGISMTKAGAQYVSVDCGTLNIEEYWGSYLDYDPYTKAEIYLPYIGTHPISTDDIMGKSVHVVYRIDILSGACCAHVKCGGSVLYSFVGQCSCSIPITGNDWTNVINGTLTIAASIGTMVATGGATAPMAVGAIASTAVNNMKPNVEKSGSMGGMGGMLGIQTPYLILTRPRQAVPKYQNKFSGYPSFITMSLGDCSGYTEIDSVHLENIAATEQELSEIESLLKGGVIL